MLQRQPLEGQPEQTVTYTTALQERITAQMGPNDPPRQVRLSRSSENRERNPSQSRQAKSTRSSEQRERIPVTGVRRIWETLRNTTPAAVSSALNKLTTSGNQLAVKRNLVIFLGAAGGGSWLKEGKKCLQSCKRSGRRYHYKPTGN